MGSCFEKSTDAPNEGNEMEPQHIADEIALTEHDENGDKVTYPMIYTNHFSSLLISHTTILSRTKKIAESIAEQYDKTQPLVLVCILKGSSPFFNMLLNHLSLLSVPYIIEFIRVKSYVGNETSGNVKMYQVEMPSSLKNRHVIVVEDIIDTGTTLKAIMPKFHDCQPKSIVICSLLVKRLNNGSKEDDKVVAKYVGFSIPDKFVVGFGLDLNEMYRDLLDLWVLGEKGIKMGGYSDC